MVRWTITFVSREEDESTGYLAIRKLLKTALRGYGLKCVGVRRERVWRDDRERRVAVAEYAKRELARRVAVMERKGGGA